jgi:glutamine amidotransferase
VFAGLDESANAYFVHSFEMKPATPAHLLATTDYGGAVTAAIGRGNIVGTQFHPEKSQAVGLQILANFLNWTP